MTEKATRTAKPAGDNPAAEPAVAVVNTTSDVKFNVTYCKMYVPVVTLQTEYETKLYEELKTGITIDFA